MKGLEGKGEAEVEEEKRNLNLKIWVFFWELKSINGWMIPGVYIEMIEAF